MKIKTFESFKQSSPTEKRLLIDSTVKKIIVDMNLKLVIKIIYFVPSNIPRNMIVLYNKINEIMEDI